MSPSPLRGRTPRPSVDRAARSLRHGARAFGFWAAVLLPLAYPGVLLSDAWTFDSRTLLVGLLGVHLLALVVGRRYRRRSSGG